MPLERDARILARHAGRHCSFVLLGSIASEKYVEPLLSVFGERLMFPGDFVGRGDMSRGGLMLRRVTDGIDLNQTDLPDPVAKTIEQLMDRIRELEADLDALRKAVDRDHHLKEDDAP